MLRNKRSAIGYIYTLLIENQSYNDCAHAMKSELVSFDTVLLNNTIEKEMFYYETKLRARRVTEIFRGGGGQNIFLKHNRS